MDVAKTGNHKAREQSTQKCHDELVLTKGIFQTSDYCFLGVLLLLLLLRVLQETRLANHPVENLCRARPESVRRLQQQRPCKEDINKPFQ